MTVHDPKLSDEIGRLASLNRYCVLDSSDESQFDRITGLVRSVFNVPIAAVSLIDVDRQWFKSMDGLDIRETPRGLSFCAHAILGRDALNVPDAPADSRFASNALVTGQPHIRAYLGAPLMTPDGFNLGALCAIDSCPRLFSAAEEALLATFAALVVDELELRMIAQTDGLTGAKTRRAFMVDLETAGRLAATRQAALVMVDVDHFKAVNDLYGHPAGDQVLHAVSAAFRSVLRRSDPIGRIGGEEFGILLNGMGPDAAVECAERLREAVAGLDFSFAPELRVTASFGVAPVTDRNPATALSAADAALYDAKRAGRNRVVAASPSRSCAHLD